MTEYEEKLVMDNLRLVDHIIRTRFHYWSASVLMTYEDLQAVGREALCRAAARYKPELGQFCTFAGRCIVNALIDHCKRETGHNKAAAAITDGDLKEEIMETAACVNVEEDMIGALAVEQVLDRLKMEYTGVARMGIEAIELKLLGLSSAAIAERYGTTVNNVNAWISRARSKLRTDDQILDLAL
jgi:RNA polymerase sigma factor, sigma-70 family